MTASPQEPTYRKVAHEDGGATQFWFIVCDEGWRESVVCQGMYEWAANWLLDTLGNQPFAPTQRSAGPPKPPQPGAKPAPRPGQ